MEPKRVDCVQAIVADRAERGVLLRVWAAVHSSDLRMPRAYQQWALGTSLPSIPSHINHSGMTTRS
jgi:hypothetical protein